jgi:hypothetical protein
MRTSPRLRLVAFAEVPTAHLTWERLWVMVRQADVAAAP